MGQDISEATLAAREITIMADKSLPYEVLKKVMATCTDADYGKISLAVLQKEKPVSLDQAPVRLSWAGRMLCTVLPKLMNWPGKATRRRSRASGASCGSASCCCWLLGILIALLPAPPRPPAEAATVPPQLARVMIEEQPKPPPPPPPPPPVVQKPQAGGEDRHRTPPPVDRIAQAREKAEKQFEQFKDQLADLREKMPDRRRGRPRT